MNEDDYTWWRRAIQGEVGPIHDEPVCGYFKVRDRRGENKNLAPVKRPWVPAAIWREGDSLVAEVGGITTAVDGLWPYCAKNPIPFEDYEHWHLNGRWPERNAA